MKKQLIEFKENNYRQALKQLDEIIDNINRAIIILVANGYKEVNISLIRSLTINKNDYINEKYVDKLRGICNVFGINFDSYDVSQDDQMKRMALSSIQFLYEASKTIRTTYLHSFLLDEKFIQIKDNVASRAIDADLNLKEYHCIYTSSEKQNTVNEILATISKELEKLEIEGIDPRKFFNLYGFQKLGNKWQIKGELLKSIVR